MGYMNKVYYLVSSHQAKDNDTAKVLMRAPWVPKQPVTNQLRCWWQD